MSVQESQRITRAAGVFGLWTLFSRILGLIRDQVVAYLFGAGLAADAFFVAFRLPNLLRRLSAEGAMASAFVPIYTRVLVEESPAAARRTAGAAFSLLAAVLVLISALGSVFAPALVRLIAPGFADEPAKFELTVLLTRIVFPYILFISLATLLMGVLNSLGHFAAPAAAPVGLNLCLIGCALLLAPHLEKPAVALALGALLGGAVQLLIQAPPLIKRRAWPQAVWAPGEPSVKLMLRRMVPVIFGAAVYQINLLVGTILASLLPQGSVSYLYYADRLVQFPLGVFAVALSTAVLPSLSRQAAQGDEAGFAESFGHGLRLSLFVVLPSALGLGLLAQPLVGLIYQHGRFDAQTAWLTTWALWGFAPGLPLAALAGVVTRAFNALQDTKTPAVMAAWSMGANILASLILMGPLGHAGLALASSAAAAVNLALLLKALYRRAPHLKAAGLMRGAGRIATASAAMAALLLVLFWLPASPLHAGRAWLQVVLGVGLGAAGYFLAAYLLRCRELSSLKAVLRR